MEYHRIYAKIDLDAIEHNIDLVKDKIGKETKLLLVIKADAYGHGSVELAKTFSEKADYFAVAEMPCRNKKADTHTRLHFSESF